MVLKKKNDNLDVGYGGGDGIQRKGSVVCGGRTHRRSRESIDHWGFLEEIDAPMWVDLTFESKKMYQDVDDHWFQVTHPFHEKSSHSLITSGLCTSVEEKACSDADFVGSSAPKLPSSVSRSRGKHFRSRKWRGDGCVRVDKQKQIRKFSGGIQQKILACGVKPKPSSGNSRCSSSMKAGLAGEINTTKCRSQYPRHASSWRPSFASESSSTETMKPCLPPAKPGYHNLRSSLSLASSSMGESNLASNSGPDPYEANCSFVRLRSSSNKLWNSTQTNCSIGDSESTLTLDGTIVGESNSASSRRLDSPMPKSRLVNLKSSLNSKVSNVTESSPREKRMATNVPCQTIGQPRGITSSVRFTLPKRSITGQPSLIEVKDRRQLKDLTNSLSKFNVGFPSNSDSNSINKLFTAAMNQGWNSQSSNLTKMDKLTNQRKGRNTNASKTSNGPLMDLTSKSKLEGKDTNIKCVHQELSKAKVSHHCESRKPSLLHQKALDPSNVQSNRKESVVNKNQVKAKGCYISSQKAGGKENNIGTMGWSQNA